MPEDHRPPNFNRDPMLWLALAFASGILVSHAVNFDLRVAIIAVAVFAITAFFLRTNRITTWLLLIAFCFAGMSAALVEKHNVSPDRLKILYDNGTLISGEPVEVEGVLLDGPKPPSMVLS